jgi:uncharacterized protein (TIGR00296 family)
MDTFLRLPPPFYAMAEARAGLAHADGVRAVELAREAVESFVQNGARVQTGSMRDAFYARTGAFVRLESTRGRRQVRGCDGRLDDSVHLGEAIVDAAIGAAGGDSCGSAVDDAELDSISVSVCAVEETETTDTPTEDIHLGTEGAVVESDGRGGWLYPTMPVENGWSAAEYLDRSCKAAGLPKTAWEEPDVDVTLFRGRIFAEDGKGVIER